MDGSQRTWMKQQSLQIGTRRRHSHSTHLPEDQGSCCSPLWAFLKPWRPEQGPQHGLLSAAPDAPLQRAFANHILPVSLSTTFRVVILCMLAALLVVSGVGISRLQEGYEMSDLAADKHMLTKVGKVDAAFMRNIGAPLAVAHRGPLPFDTAHCYICCCAIHRKASPSGSCHRVHRTCCQPASVQHGWCDLTLGQCGIGDGPRCHPGRELVVQAGKWACTSES